MKVRLCIFGILLVCATARAEQSSEQPAQYRQFKGEYSIYSGELGEQLAPQKNERKVSFIIDGHAAKRLFDAMGPDDKYTCTGNKGDRSRTKGKLWCTFHRSDGYTCYFGFDLRTGESIGGGIC